MATRTSTSTSREITKKGDVVTVKVVEKTTTIVPGKEPEVKEVTRVEEFKGEEGYKRLPEDIRRELEEQGTSIPKSAGTTKAHHVEDASKEHNKNGTRGNFVEEALKEHNKYRQTHGAMPLKITPELMKASEEKAKEMAAKDDNVLRSDGNYGVNTDCAWSSDPNHTVTAAEVVASWYEGSKNYKYHEEPKDRSHNNFTQIVWRESTDFGIAAAKSNSNKIYVVALYWPSGNVRGQFSDNVNPPGTKVSKPVDKLPYHHHNPQDLNQESVAVHNKYRAKHGVPPLTFNQEVANYAQEWADELARKDKFEHRTERKYGENLYSFSSSDPNATASAADACDAWYAEIKDFSFKAEPKTLASGHFTQMIWKTSKEVGMGRAKTKKGLQIIVANYNPPGNFVGKFLENVPKPIS